MGETKEKKAKRFFKNVRGWKRFLLFTGIYLFVFVALFSLAAEYTSRPSFCPSCHYMETFYQSWRTSAHNKVDCVECHFEPGISGTIKGKLNGLVQIVNYVSLTYKKRKPWAEIPDNACARSGCHETQALSDSVYNFKGIEFSHKHHLEDLKRGKKLKCISCHSQIVQGTHMEVTPSTCNTCHFKKSSDPEHKFEKLSDCRTCHKLDSKPKVMLAGMRYNHTSVVDNKIECSSCHSVVTSGNGEVGKERCFQCHFETERLDKFDDTEFMHKIHISKHSMACINCHSSIEHKIQKIDPSGSPDCNSCHSNAHSSQVSLFSGENGFNVDATPSSMFINGISCKGCHVFHERDRMDISTSKARGSSCEKCHGPGYDRLVKEWEVTTVKRLAAIQTIYNTVRSLVKNSESSRREDAEKLIEEAYHNLRLVEVGKSVHNVQFADKLLVGSYGLMKEALTIIGTSAGLPDFRSSSDVIPNECYRCHGSIQEISLKKFGMNFSHNLHIVKNKVGCERCHSNVNNHGELIINKESCNSCHHSKNKTNETCGKCHSFQTQVYEGSYLNKNQPDFMKEGGTGCIDCHISADNLNKPDDKICAKCHDASYSDMMGEWKGEVKKLTDELNEMIRGMNTANLNEEQKSEFAEIKKIVSQISSYPSIYVHNYDLISSVLTEKRKQLKKMIQ